ncbi:MAG: phage tail tube protein [Pseudomonadota bacterium]|nr:phage tail tube protein [Pseudomonadota bacterium]
MALPVLHYRGDMVLMAALDPASPAVFANFCGATGVTISVSNNMQEVQTGDCEDWNLPIQTLVAYGAQTVTMTINAQLARGNRDRILRWAVDQLEIPLRLHIVDAASGEIEYVDGIGMLGDFGLDGIGNTEGAVITTSLTIRFKTGVEFTNAA